MTKVLGGIGVVALITATSAYAGGMDEPMMEPEVVIEEATGSSTGEFVFPLMMLVILAGIATN